VKCCCDDLSVCIYEANDDDDDDKMHEYVYISLWYTSCYTLYVIKLITIYF